MLRTFFARGRRRTRRNGALAALAVAAIAMSPIGGGVAVATPAGAMTFYTNPSISGPYEVVTGSDGAMWFTNSANASIGRITTSGAVSNFTAPGVTSPYGITA